jgi:hypothetical protein
VDPRRRRKWINPKPPPKRCAGCGGEGRASADVAQRGQDKHLHDSCGVTLEEMRQASMG